MSLANSFVERRAERTSLLSRLTHMLQQDERIVAAWLCGSFGTGKADDLSDLDVAVVVADERLDDFATERRAFAARVGEVLFFVEGPQNAPDAGGYYLMAAYEGQTGPHLVDWYWHAQGRVVIPTATLVLFDQVGLPRGQTPPAWGYTQNKPEALRRVEAAMTEPEKRADEGRNLVSAFWAMLLTAAKYVVRARDNDSNVPFSGFLRNLLRDTRGFLDPTQLAEVDAPGDDEVGTVAAAKTRRLRELASEMEHLMPRLAATGAAVPGAAPESARRFLDRVEAATGG